MMRRGYHLITGGAGFIGSNLADRLLSAGERVLVYDNLSRQGVGRNLSWLREKHGDSLEVRIADIRDSSALASALAGAKKVYHFAAQVAVTSSLESPLEDFDINARATLHLLELMRHHDRPPSLLFTSTNKVYGNLSDLHLELRQGRYEPEDEMLRRHGVGEKRPLDLYSPYGCSKGAADQYVLDYARSYGLQAVVFRMSCIYGPRQFGTEDQGWLAHFLIRALEGKSITLYGDGRQVRDVLYVGDLIDAMRIAQEEMPRLSGQAFNIGGGAEHVVSLLEVVERIGASGNLRFGDWRTGDQRYYVSDIRKFARATGWRPRVGVEEGIRRLQAWLRDQRLSLVTAQREGREGMGAL